MEIIRNIQNWIYPIIDLALMIYCLVSVKKKGAGFLAIGFGVLLFSSLSWRIVDLLKLYENYENYQIIYTIMGQISFFSNLIFAILFIMGISQIISSTDYAREKVMQGNLANQNASNQSFGNVGIYIAMLLIGLFIFLIGISLVQERASAVSNK